MYNLAVLRGDKCIMDQQVFQELAAEFELSDTDTLVL